MPKGKKKSNTQTFLAFIFAAILSIGFIGVYYVDAYYESNGTSVILWQTDSDANPNRKIVYVNSPYEQADYYGTVQIEGETGIPYIFNVYNRTAVYTGNNTWTYAANETGGNYRNRAMYVFDLPNTENWIIKSVNYSFSTNGDSDLAFGLSIDYPISNKIDYESTYKKGTILDTVFSFTPIDNHYYRNLTVPLATSLDIVDNSVNIPNNSPVLTFYIDDVDADGLSAWAFTIDIEINGYPLDATSMNDQINLVIGGSAILNIIAVFFLTDEIDIGGFKKDLKKRR